MESTSVKIASISPIPSNPQVPILPFPHHSMLLLWRITSVLEKKKPSSTSHVVSSIMMLNSIPLYVENLWIGCFDTSGLTEFSFNRFLSLKSLVLGSNTLWYVTQFELNGLPSLQSIDIGKYGCRYAPSFSLTSVIDGLV